MNWFVVSLIVCSTLATGVLGVLYESPVSTAAIVGQSVVFPCTGNEDNETLHAYSWLYNPLSNEPIVIVYDCQVNPAFADTYSAELNENGGCNLIISNLVPRLAGTYTCQHWYDQGSAQLVVLNTNSNCQFRPVDLVTGDFIEILCFVNFNGSVAPRMDFRSENGRIYTNATINTFDTQVNGRVQFPVYPPITQNATANTYFVAPIEFSYTWTLPQIFVQFPVTNIAIEVQSDYECGNYVNFTRLRCTADGFPAPSFAWTDMSSGEVIATDTITLNKAGVNDYSCTAKNAIRDQESVIETQITVNVSDDEPTTCAPSPTEPITTTPEPTTTTEEPTTTTSQEIPVTECGSIMQVSPEGTPIAPGYSRSCFISRQNDTDYVNTPCRNLIQRLPPGIGDYAELLRRGGNFGCSLSTRQDFVGADTACFDNYQHTLTLAASPTSTKLIVCIKLPPSGRQ